MKNRKYIDVGDNIEIIYLDKENEPMILETAIYDVVDSEHLLINNPIYEGNLYFLPMNKEVSVTVKKENVGVVNFDMVFLEREKKSSVYTVKCKITSEIEKHQRRRYYRVKTYEDIKLSNFDDDEDISVNLLNISGVGILISTNKDLEMGSTVYANIEFLGEDFIIPGKIVRKIEKDSKFEYGIEFENLNNKDIKTILAYVFKKQLANKNGDLNV